MRHTSHNGTKHAKHAAPALRPLVTVEDLRTILHLRLPRRLVGDLETAASHVSKFVGLTLDELPIDTLLDMTYDFSPFKTYLRERRYKPNSIRDYCGSVKNLTKKAKELGWLPQRPEVPDSWKSVVAALKPYGCTKIVQYAIRHNLTPTQFGDAKLAAWEEEMGKKGRSYAWVHGRQTAFRRALVKSKCDNLFPGISKPTSASQYAIRLRLFPPDLRADVVSLLKWKQADFAPGRPRKCRHRAITAARLEDCIARLYGFVTMVANGNGHGHYSVAESPITSLPALANRESVTAWVDWRINERKNKGAHVSGDLALLSGAMRYYPGYKAHNFDWLGKLILELPEDPKSEITESKARKYVPYELLSDIPRMLHERRSEISTKGAKQLAWLVHDELLINWLTTLVWRQRNIRECRIGSNAELVNLFKGTIPPFVAMAKPKWVEEELAINPHKQCWQFYFREDETKNGYEVRAFLPRQLVGPLEEYLELYRPALLQGHDPGTLFINRTGEALASHNIRDLVANITFRYVHRRVTPHVFRDIFAYKWLDDHPEDYLTLSKILWHRNINTTLQKYGRRFDESNGVRKLEEWLIVMSQGQRT